MGVIEWIGAIFGGIAINLVASELFAWGPRVSERLTRWAVRRLPVEKQERMREEWVGHLDALHPLSRTLAAAGFVLAAYRISVSFDRNSRGALTILQWLSPKPLIAVVLTEKLATSMARRVNEINNVEYKNSDATELDGGPEDFLVRLNMAARGKKLRNYPVDKPASRYRMGGIGGT